MSAYRPPSTLKIGFPVRVMAMSERKRFPTAVCTAARALRPAMEGEAILSTNFAVNNWLVRNDGC